MVSAKTRAPPRLSSSRLTLVTTANFRRELLNRLRYATRLVKIDGLRTAFGYGAKATAAGAQVPQQHECGGAMVPALANVGTVGRLANRVQLQPASQCLQIVIIFAHGRACFQPLRLGSRLARSNIDLNQFGSRGHGVYLLYKPSAVGRQPRQAACQCGHAGPMRAMDHLDQTHG